MKDVLIWELKRRRFALFWWSAGSIIMSVVIMSLYPSIRDQAQQLNQVINQLPGGLRGLKTGGQDVVNVADPVAFLNSQLFYATLPILWIILAITRGSELLGREEASKTLELLLARPLSRTALLFAKLLCIIAEFAIVAGTTLLVIVVVAPLVGLHVATLHLAMATLYTALFSLSFGLIAFALQAASFLTRKAATAVAVLVSFGGYLLASLSGLTDWLKTPAKFAPYHYFDPEAVMHGQSAAGLNIYLAGIALVCATVAYLGFRNRDIS
jgi:ABC-2 type transport system permease protein